MTDSPTSDHDDPRQDGVAIGDVQGGIVGSIVAGGNVIQHITNVLTGADGRDRRNQLLLLDKVAQFWIAGVLEQSVHRESLLALGMVEQPEAVEHPWNMVVEVAGQEPTPVPAGMTIADVFERAGRSLLILGEPGSGKTMTLLELARDAATRARGDAGAPIPVVFNLSSWGQKRRNLFEWLVDELNEKYQIPKKIGRRWIDADDLLLLLDGLDEVAPERLAACVTAINDFRGEHGLTTIAVSSRAAEYRSQQARLSLQGAILLQPLTPDQVDRYLRASGSKLAALRAMLAQDASLQELAASPLMLGVMTLAYADAPPADDNQPGGESADSRRHRLFETYVARMVRRRGRAHDAENAKSIRRLSWLARGMQKHGQSIFLLEELQPSWLQTRIRRWLYALGSRLLAAVFIAAALVLAVIGAAIAEPDYWDTVLFVAVLTTIGCVGAGFLIGVVDAFRLGRAVRRPAALRTESRLRIGARAAAVSFVAAIGFVLPYLVEPDQLLMVPFMISLAAPDRIRTAALLAYPLVLVLPFGLILGARRRTTISMRDIRTVENLVWSWRPFAGALAVAVLVGIGVFARASYVRNPSARLSDASGGRLAFLDSQQDRAESVRFNRDGTRILTIGGRVTTLWTSDGEHVADLLRAGRSPRFSPDGGFVESVVDDDRVWRSTDGHLVTDFGDWYWFSPGGNRLVAKKADEAALLDSRSGAVLSRFPIDNRISRDLVAFDRSGRRFVTVGPRGLVLTSAADGRAIASLAQDGNVHAFAWSPEGSQIITVGEKACRLWSGEDGSLLGGLPQAQVAGARFTPDGSRIVTRGDTGALTLWDARSRTPIAALDSVVGDMDYLVFNADPPRMLAEDRARGVQLWDLAGGTLITTFDRKAAAIRRFSPDGKLVATTALDGTVTLSQSTSGARVATLEEKGGLGWLRYNRPAVEVYPVFNESGTRLVTARDDGVLRLWDARTGKAIASMDGALPFSRFDAFAEVDSLFSAAGNLLASLDTGGTLRLYDASTGQLNGSIVGVAQARINRDGTRVATVTAPANVVPDNRAMAAVPLAFGLLVGIFFGLRAGVSARKTYPNQGIWLSARNAAIMGALCGGAFALIPTVAVGRIDRETLLMMIGPLAFFGVLTFLWYGGADVLNHLVLRLALRRDLPLRSRRFLARATDRVLLRRVGGGYIFVHRLLLEHFAQLDPSR